MSLQRTTSLLLNICLRRPSGLKNQVRYKRGYRDQHVKQAIPQETLKTYRKITGQNPEVQPATEFEVKTARQFRYVHPDFLPTNIPEHRDAVAERLEREDMMKRRHHLDIPEFYVGSLMAVTLSDPYADKFESRFVGICIQRADTGLRHNFTLRNVVDGQGVEIMYDMYNPTIKKIEVLRLEKRLDEELLYLRDAPVEYSTVPFDLEATPHPKGAPVPINNTKVHLNPRPWRVRWELHKMNGIEDDYVQHVTEKRLRKAENKANTKPWEKYDLMKQYRETVVDEDEQDVYVYFTKEQAKLERKKAQDLDKLLEQQTRNKKKTE